MPVYTETKTYRTKAHMGMIDVTDDFRAAVQNACRNTGMKSGTITGFTTGGVAGLTTLEFEPGMVYHDQGCDGCLFALSRRKRSCDLLPSS